MFKKIAVTGIIVVTFIIYSIHQRNEGSQAVQRVATGHTNSATSGSTVNSSTNNAGSSSVTSTSTVSYKDGSYTGKSSDAFYGYVQVKATVSGGKLTDVTVLDYPHDRENSVMINNDALPQLKQEAIQNQTAQVDGVSGATDTSQAFIESLSDALAQATA